MRGRWSLFRVSCTYSPSLPAGAFQQKCDRQLQKRCITVRYSSSSIPMVGPTDTLLELMIYLWAVSHFKRSETYRTEKLLNIYCLKNLSLIIWNVFVRQLDFWDSTRLSFTTGSPSVHISVVGYRSVFACSGSKTVVCKRGYYRTTWILSQQSGAKRF